MRKNTILAALYLPAVLFDKRICAETVRVIKRTITEQAVDILTAFMTRIELTVFICEEC